MKTKLTFIGLSEGPYPVGRQPLFRCGGSVLTIGQLTRLGLRDLIPHEQQIAMQRALFTFDNSALCEDDLCLRHP